MNAQVSKPVAYDATAPPVSAPGKRECWGGMACMAHWHMHAYAPQRRHQPAALTCFWCASFTGLLLTVPCLPSPVPTHLQMCAARCPALFPREKSATQCANAAGRTTPRAYAVRKAAAVRTRVLLAAGRPEQALACREGVLAWVCLACTACDVWGLQLGGTRLGGGWVECRDAQEQPTPFTCSGASYIGAMSPLLSAPPCNPHAGTTGLEDDAGVLQCYSCDDGQTLTQDANGYVSLGCTAGWQQRRAGMVCLMSPCSHLDSAARQRAALSIATKPTMNHYCLACRLSAPAPPAPTTTTAAACTAGARMHLSFWGAARPLHAGPLGSLRRALGIEGMCPVASLLGLAAALKLPCPGYCGAGTRPCPMASASGRRTTAPVSMPCRSGGPDVGVHGRQCLRSGAPVLMRCSAGAPGALEEPQSLYH